jgi:hypothetical protein
MPKASALSRISTASRSRLRSDSFLESARPIDRPRRIKDHGGGIDRPGKRAAAGFVNAANQTNVPAGPSQGDINQTNGSRASG